MAFGSKKQKVKLLEDEISFISETQKEAQEFMSNLEKFVLRKSLRKLHGEKVLLRQYY